MEIEKQRHYKLKPFLSTLKRALPDVQKNIFFLHATNQQTLENFWQLVD
jgi:hypothetical protein